MPGILRGRPRGRLTGGAGSTEDCRGPIGMPSNRLFEALLGAAAWPAFVENVTCEGKVMSGRGGANPW